MKVQMILNKEATRSKLFAIVFIFFIEALFLQNILAASTGLDNQIAQLVMEHWFHVATGKEALLEHAIFYPMTATVGYIDMMIFLAIPYSVFRFFGADGYISMVAAACIIHAIGTLALYTILNKKLKFSVLASILGTVCFSYSNAYAVQVGHIYLLALSLVPLIVLLSFCFFDAIETNRKKRNIYGYLTVFCISLIFYTSIYVAQFFLLFTAIFLSVFLAYLYCGKHGTHVTIIWNYLKKCYKEVLGFITFGIFLMIPFLYIYYPLYKESGGGYSAKETLYFALDFQDMFNVGSSNFLYGNTIANLGIHQGEWTVGVPLIELFLIVIACIFICKKKNSSEQSFEEKVRMYFVKSCAIASIICVTLIIKIGDDFCLWLLLRLFIPGLSSMRALARLMLFLMIPIGIVVAYFVDYFLQYKEKSKWKRIYYTLFIILLGIVVLENTQATTLTNQWKHSEIVDQEKELNCAPPSDCESFFIIDTQGMSGEATLEQLYKAIISAWRIADKYNIKTLNGVASIFPNETYDLFTTYDHDYLSNVGKWINKYNLKNVYAYDVQTKVWYSLEKIMPQYAIEKGFSTFESNEEEEWYWAIDNSAEIRLWNWSNDEDQSLNLAFTLGNTPDGKNKLIEIYCENELLIVANSGENINLTIDIKKGENKSLEFVTYDALYRGESDSRSMAFKLTNFKIEERGN